MVQKLDRPLASSQVQSIPRTVDPDAIVIVDVFSKKANATPVAVIKVCRRRLREYDDA